MQQERYRFQNFDVFRAITGDIPQFLAEGYQHIIRGEGVEQKETENISFPQVLYIDGITSAGKTTLLDNLAIDIHGATLVSEFSADIPPKYQNIGQDMPIVDQLRAEFWFYQQYVKKDKEIRKMSKKVIVDRAVLGLFCYSNMLGEQSEVSARVMLRARQRQWVPGLYVFLTARPEVLRQRLVSRQDSGAITHQDWDNGVSNFIHTLYLSTEEVARKSNSPLIDTSDKSPEEIAQDVKKLYDQFCITS